MAHHLTGREVQAVAHEAEGHHDSSDAAAQREGRCGERKGVQNDAVGRKVQSSSALVP